MKIEDIILSLIIGIVGSIITLIVIKLFKPKFKLSKVILKDNKQGQDVFKIKIVNKTHSKLFNVNYMLYIVKAETSTTAKNGKPCYDHCVTYSELAFRYKKLTMLSENKFKNDYYLNACILSFFMENQTDDNKKLLKRFLSGEKNVWLEFSIYGERPWFETSKFESRIYEKKDILENKKFIEGNTCDVCDIE